MLRKGLSPLATTISTTRTAPVIAGIRLRAGKTGSGKGARRMVAQAIAIARAAGATGNILVRGDSAYGTRAVVRACLRGKLQFSLVMSQNQAIRRAIDSIAADQWTPVRYSNAVHDPGTGGGSLMPRSPKCLTPHSPPPQTGSAPGWWCAGSKTPATPTRCSRSGGITRFSPIRSCPPPAHHRADLTHRRHVIIETVFADLIDGPLAHLPSGRFDANSAWVLCAAIAHNLLRTAGALTGEPHHVARGATLRRRIITVPARLARPGRNPSCTYHAAGLGHLHGCGCGTTSSATAHQPPPDHPRRHPARAANQWKSWTDQQLPHAPQPNKDQQM